MVLIAFAFIFLVELCCWISRGTGLELCQTNLSCPLFAGDYGVVLYCRRCFEAVSVCSLKKKFSLCRVHDSDTAGQFTFLWTDMNEMLEKDVQKKVAYIKNNLLWTGLANTRHVCWRWLKNFGSKFWRWFKMAHTAWCSLCNFDNFNFNKKKIGSFNTFNTRYSRQFASASCNKRF